MTEKCLLGSEGGGCGEQEVITEARRVLVTGEFDVIDLDMTNEVAENQRNGLRRYHESTDRFDRRSGSVSCKIV